MTSHTIRARPQRPVGSHAESGVRAGPQGPVMSQGESSGVRDEMMTYEWFGLELVWIGLGTCLIGKGSKAQSARCMQMPQPGYCSVVFGVLRDFGNTGQAIGWRKRKISTDYNKVIVVQLPFVERSMRKTLSSGSSSITLLHRAMWIKRRLTGVGIFVEKRGVFIVC